jgi:copper chaperone
MLSNPLMMMLAKLFSLLRRSSSESREDAKTLSEGYPLQTVSFKVENMACEGCARTIKKIILEFDGAYEVKVDIKTKLVEVSFDPSKTKDSEFRQALLNHGYIVA